VKECEVRLRDSGVGCQVSERETQELKPEFWILTSNLRLAVSPRPRVILLRLVPSPYCLVLLVP